MAIDQLIRETNPAPGTTPGFVPQHGLAGGGYEKTYGQNNALYTVIYGADGKTPISSVNRIPVDLTGQTVSTQLTGSIVQSNPSSLQGLVNTTAGTLSFFACNGCLNPKARNRLIGIYNTGDQDAEVHVYPYLKSIGSKGTNVELTVTVPANLGVQYITDGQLNEIKAPFDSLDIGVDYSVALPTNGGGVDVYIQELT